METWGEASSYFPCEPEWEGQPRLPGAGSRGGGSWAHIKPGDMGSSGAVFKVTSVFQLPKVFSVLYW